MLQELGGDQIHGGAGHMLAGYAGLRRVPTGLSMVAIGAALVALTIGLGG